jgi:phosphate transport system substrate-binding protein
MVAPLFTPYQCIPMYIVHPRFVYAQEKRGLMLFQYVAPSRQRQRPVAHIGAFLLLTLLVALSACGGGGSSSNTAQCPKTNKLTGAGATFPYPLYSKMFSQYAQTGCKVQVNYQSVGSGAGKTQLINQTVDFGASDGPMTDAELNQSKNGPILHIPMTLGSEALAYNLPSVPADKHIKLTGTLIANIFLGKVTKWNDPAITQLNTDITLPDKDITVVHRSDGSGTTSIFTHYLSAVSPEWSSKVGAGTTVNWPLGIGGKGNEGVAGSIKTTENSLGYVELAYVLANKMQYSQVKSKDGEFLSPSLDTAKADAQNFTNIPADLRFYIVNASGKNSYPISGYSWLLVYQNQKDADHGQALANMLWWMSHDGQQYSSALTYVPLPNTIVQKDEEQIKKLQCGGSPCYKG